MPSDAIPITVFQEQQSNRINTALIPIIVDLDGTLTPADTLVESFVLVLKRNIVDALRLPFWVLKGPAEFKKFIASKSAILVELLPYRAEFLDYLRGEKEKGRQIILATETHRIIAERVAAHLGLFDEILASDGVEDLKGETRLEAIRGKVGDKFIYAGHSTSDLPIWKAAEAAILVGVPPGVAAAVQANTPIKHEFPREDIRLAIWLSALRIHQWLKNCILFVPLLTSFSFLDVEKLASVCVAFFAFCFAASSMYLVNDLWDLENDRAHPRKRHRPFASARIPILQGAAAAAGALLLALGTAATVSWSFFVMLLLYLTLAGLYSGALKKFAMIDVLTLSLLYTLRVLAGSAAAGVQTSSWLLAFSVFMFFSLALLKRCSELAALAQSGRSITPGRDYRITDLVVLWPLGVGSALCAIVVFGLFISTVETQVRYASPQLLWFVAVGLAYWNSRFWIKAARGEMHDDPLVFAFRDFGSCATLFIMLITTLAAYLLPLNYP